MALFNIFRPIFAAFFGALNGLQFHFFSSYATFEHFTSNNNNRSSSVFTNTEYRLSIVIAVVLASYIGITNISIVMATSVLTTIFPLTQAKRIFDQQDIQTPFPFDFLITAMIGALWAGVLTYTLDFSIDLLQ